MKGSMLLAALGPLVVAACGFEPATPLARAAAEGNLAAVRDLLRRGADPYATAPGGVTALSNAAGGGALFDFTDGPPLGTCHGDTIRALRARAPDLRIEPNAWNHAALWLGKSAACAEAKALLTSR